MDFLIDALRLRGSVIPTVLPDVLFITTFTALVQLVQSTGVLPFDLFFPNIIGKFP